MMEPATKDSKSVQKIFKKQMAFMVQKLTDRLQNERSHLYCKSTIQATKSNESQYVHTVNTEETDGIYSSKTH